MTPSTSASLLGAVLGDRYEVIRHIARGGMSDVYAGRDRLLQRSVAVEVHRAGGPTDSDAFVLPEHVQVYDAGEHGDDSFVVLELSDERTLRSIVEGRVDHDAPTTIVPVPDGTTVMPAVLVPRPPEAPATATAAEGPSRRALWLVLGAIALVLVLLATQGGGGIDVTTPTTEPVVVTSPPPPPSTAPPTTAPPAAQPGKGKGHGKKG